MDTNIGHIYKFTVGKQTYTESYDDWIVMKKFMNTIEKKYLQNMQNLSIQRQVNKS